MSDPDSGRKFVAKWRRECCEEIILEKLHMTQDAQAAADG